MRPNKQRPIEFSNVCQCIVDENELEKAIIWFQSQFTKSKKKIYMHGYYPAVTIGKKKIHVHRLLGCYWNGRILRSDEYCHHKNHNKLDSRKSNIEVMALKDHQSLHNKGKKLSKEHRRLISEKGRLRKGMIISKRVEIDLYELSTMLKRGDSILSISKHFKCDWSTVKLRINQNPDLLNQQ